MSPTTDDTGIDAYSNVEFKIEFLTNSLAKRSDLVNDGQTGKYSTFRVILVRKGRAEEGHDAVAHHAGQRAFVSVNWGDEIFERFMHHLGPVFRVKVFSHGGRTDDIAKEN